MRLCLLSIISILICSSATAAERPLWASKAPEDTASKLYFVGRSPLVDSEAEGVRMAIKDAREQLLRQEFGTTVRVDNSQTETLTTVSADSKLSEVSDLILLKGFRQQDVHSQSRDSKFEVWVLFEVPKSEIQSEKERVTALQDQKRKITPSASPREFDNGGRPKLRKGMRKSQVIELFGKPEKVEVDYDNSTSFAYSSPSVCQEYMFSFYRCSIRFDKKGKVGAWYQVKSELTTDLDDVNSVQPVSKNHKMKKTSQETYNNIETTRSVPDFLSSSFNLPKLNYLEFYMVNNRTAKTEAIKTRDIKTIEQFIKSGTYSFLPGVRINVTAADGEAGTIDSKEIKIALENGYEITFPLKITPANGLVKSAGRTDY